MEPFATVEDYELRYGDAEDREQLEALLEDATSFILDHERYGLRIIAEGEPGYERQRASLRRVTCSVVHRTLLAGELAGASSYSETAGSYNASVNVYNPSGDMFLTAQECRALGIGGGRIGQTDPYGEVVGGV